MAYKYINASSALLKNIQQSNAADAGKSSWKKPLEQFVSSFFYLVPEEDVVDYKTDELKAIATQAFKFFADYSGVEPSIRIFNPSVEKDGWQTPYTIVEVVNVDKPFLVDSVSEELTRQGYDIQKIFHPVLGVKRNAKGGLEDLHHAEESNGTRLESFLHFQVSHTTDEKKMAELEVGIANVLKSVNFAVADWEKVLSHLDVVISLFSLASHSLEPNLKQNEKDTLRANAAEVMDFLSWLKDDNFVFLGYEEYTYQDNY